MKTTLLFTCLFLFSLTSTISAQTVSLGNSVWWDMNDNGKKDIGEPAASGFTVKLYQDNNDDGVADAGFTALTTTTDGNGKFLFTNLTAGKYFTRLSAGTGHYKGTVYGGDPDNNIVGDNNGYSQDLGTYNIFTETITLAPGTEPDGTGATNTNTNNTLGMCMWKGNGLGDIVWLDANANGMQDGGETGLGGVTVLLKNSAGSVLETTTTNAEGYYSFFNPVGNYGTNNYQLEFVTPTGFAPTLSNFGGDDNLDSDPVGGIVTGINVPTGTWDHSLDAGFKPLAPLPVKLLGFGATLGNNNVSLKWGTENEINLNHFELEKSVNGEKFTSAGIVFANGNSILNNYAFSDKVNTTEANIIYYRLRLVDKNGSSEYSEIIRIKISNETKSNLSIITYPNPVINEVHVTLPVGWQNKKVMYEVFNASGGNVKKMEIEKSILTQIINVTNLSAGFYIVRATCQGGTVQQKMIKN